MYRDKSAVSEGNYEGGRELRFKSIQIPTCRFMRIMEDCMDERIKSEVKCLLRSTSKLQATAYTKRLLTEIDIMEFLQIFTWKVRFGSWSLYALKK